MSETLCEQDSLLQQIESPGDVRDMDLEALKTLAGEIRNMIIQTVSTNGGHLAPSLGVVELTLALLKVFNPASDRLIWDVGHQAYAYKILTNRRDRFHTLRQYGGVCGFPRLTESPYDHFGVGHSSTSISAGLGMAMGRDLSGEKYSVLSVIGDGSMTAGLAYEGLNQAGGMDRNLIVVLNDNEMSIAKNVGALSSFLSRNLSSRWAVRLKREADAVMRQIPVIGAELANYARRSHESFKSLFTPGMLFEAFRFNYLGPIDGHDLSALIDVFEQVKGLDGPQLVHVLTKKGKGYRPAEINPSHFHGVGCFEPETGKSKKIAGASCLPTYTEVFGHTLCKLAAENSKIVAITAAMPEGTGLTPFSEQFPDRFVDVGICEQHAVTFAAGLAVQGFRPVVAIYSTFMQRSYDQIVHDVCLQELPVTLCLDRAGLVGEDGATHHGAFDISYLRHVPNLIFMAPMDEIELADMLVTAIEHSGPVALRYPRGVGIGAQPKEKPEALPIGKGVMVREGTDAVIIGIGNRVHPSIEAANEIEAETGKKVAVFNARFIKPLDEEALLDLAARFDRILTVEENVLAGGFGSAVLELFSDRGALRGQRIVRLGLPDKFVEHGQQKLLRRDTGIDQDGIKKATLDLLR